MILLLIRNLLSKQFSSSLLLGISSTCLVLNDILLQTGN
jgi:hypothetical protein